jgi:hypothetical protein
MTLTRLERLAGGRGEGGGLVLPPLFAAILEELLDHGSADDARMVRIATTSSMNLKSNAVTKIWSSWEAFTADVLEQMEDGGFVQRGDDGAWRTGVNFRTGELLVIIPGGKGRKPDGVVVWEAAEREEWGRDSHFESEAASAVAGGVRPLNRAQVESLRESATAIRADHVGGGDGVLETGQIYPVLFDKDGHVLDGRHRLAADPNWRRQRLKVGIDSPEALAVIRAANSGQPLPKKVGDRIDELILGAKTARERKRERIETALKEWPTLSHNAIATRLDVHHSAVDRACDESIAQRAMDSCEHRLQEDGTPAPVGRKGKDKPDKKPSEKPGRVDTESVKQQVIGDVPEVPELTTEDATPAAVPEDAISGPPPVRPIGPEPIISSAGDHVHLYTCSICGDRLPSGGVS